MHGRIFKITCIEPIQIQLFKIEPTLLTSELLLEDDTNKLVLANVKAWIFEFTLMLSCTVVLQHFMHLFLVVKLSK